MRASLLLLLVLAACGGDEEIVYEQYNALNDTLEIQVGIEDTLDPAEILLYSTTGEVEVGSAVVRPGGGPIGTRHDMVVVVYDEYQDVVDRASVRTDSGSRGKDEYDLTRDSADEGVYKLTLESDGIAGEVRTDELTFRLWDALVVEEADTQTADESAK
jgi:hypothetical protein